MFIGPKYMGNDVSLIILAILVFSKMATVGHLGFGPVQKKFIRFGNFTQIILKALIYKRKIHLPCPQGLI